MSINVLHNDHIKLYSYRQGKYVGPLFNASCPLISKLSAKTQSPSMKHAVVAAAAVCTSEFHA